MGEFFRRVGRWVGKITGYSNLESSFLQYFVVYAVYSVATLLSSAYFNVYLLRVTGSSMALMIYNLVAALVQPLVMLAAVKVMRCTSVTLCMQIGLVLHALGYLLLAAVGYATEQVVYAASAIISSANAFFFTAYTPQYLHYTHEDNRDTAFGALGLFGTVINLLLPVVTGFFISSFGDLTGYRILFALTSLGMLISAALALRLTPIAQDRTQRRGHLRMAARSFFGSRTLRECMGATALDALRTSGATYFASLLMFELLRQEAVMGVVNTASAILAMLANVLYGRFVKAKNRGHMMLAASCVQVLAVVIVCLWRTAPGYVVYSVLGSLVGVFLANPVVTSYIGEVEKDPVLREHGGEAHTLREFFYTAGRALGLLPVFFLPDPAQAAPVMMVVMTALQIPASLLTIQLQKKRHA